MPSKKSAPIAIQKPLLKKKNVEVYSATNANIAKENSRVNERIFA
jgi:hypothetical protein